MRLRLLEIPQGLRAAEGAALELQDCAFPLLADVEVTDDPAVAFDGCNIALLVGARPRGPGMERADLLAANAGIFGPQGAALNAARGGRRARRRGRATPPTRTRSSPRHPPPTSTPSRFTALTRLDENRAKGQLAEALGRAGRRHPERHASGATTPPRSSPMSRTPPSAAAPVTDALAERLDGDVAAWLDDTFLPRVAKRGAEIIEVRGSSSVASAANATIDHVRDWVHGTGEGWTSAGVVSRGEYGVPEGLVCSFPVPSDGTRWQHRRGPRARRPRAARASTHRSPSSRPSATPSATSACSERSLGGAAHPRRLGHGVRRARHNRGNEGAPMSETAGLADAATRHAPHDHSAEPGLETSPLHLPHAAADCPKCFTELQRDRDWWQARPAGSRLVGLVVARDGMPPVVEQRDDLTRFGVPIEGFRHPAPETSRSWEERLDPALRHASRAATCSS